MAIGYPLFKVASHKTKPGPSKLEKVVDPGSGPRGPQPEIGVHYLNLVLVFHNI